MPETNKNKSFLSRFTKKPKNELAGNTEITISAAKKTKKPQINGSDLSHAAQHLLLLLQHSVDEKKICVSLTERSWNALEIINPDIIEKKKHIKLLCNIHHFSPKEKDVIANRVTDFVQTHQPEMVVSSK